jgi:hypothetical protein
MTAMAKSALQRRSEREAERDGEDARGAAETR